MATPNFGFTAVHVRVVHPNLMWMRLQPLTTTEWPVEWIATVDV